MTTTNSTPSTKRMVWIALFTAITCILAPLSIPIPISPVPITLTNLVLFISLYLLSWKEALTSYILYLLLGVCGLPVFSGFSGGIGTCGTYRRISGRIYFLDFDRRIFYANTSKEKDSDDSWHGTWNGCHLYLWNAMARCSDGTFLYRRLIRRSPSVFAWRRRQNCRRLHNRSDTTEPSLFYPR